MTTRAMIGLGSNLGDRRSRLDAAIAALAATPRIRVRAVSSYQQTAPVGGPPGQGAFLNAAASIDTSLEASPLLHRLRAIEAQEGRTREAHWSERTLDLDLLLYGTEVIENRSPVPDSVPSLQVPHPWLPFRRFVLGPLVEIAPDCVHPTTGRTIAELLANLDRLPRCVALSATLGRARERVFEMLVASGIGEGIRFDPFAAQPLGIPNQSVPDDTPTIEEFERLLRLNRWTASVPQSRWLITNAWFDDLVLRDDSFHGDWTAFRNRFLELRATIVAPTFAVARTGEGQRFSRASNLPRWRPPLGAVPVLEVDAGDSDAAVAKILVACAAAE